MTVCCCERFAGPSFGHCVRHVQAGDEVEALGDLEKKSGFMTFNRSVVNCTKQLTVMGFFFFLWGPVSLFKVFGAFWLVVITWVISV